MRCEIGTVVNLFCLQLFLYFIKLLVEFLIISSWEAKKTSRISTNSLNFESLGREMCAFNEEHFIDIAWNAWEEFNDDLVFFAGSDLSSHGVAVDDARARDSGEIHIELERDFANVLDEEFLGGGLVVGDLAVVQLARGQFVGDEAGLAHDGNFVVGPAVHATHRHAIVEQAVTRIERELHGLCLAGHQHAAHWKDIENFIYRKHLRLLATLLIVLKWTYHLLFKE